jgi:hypothetical protein
MRSFELFCFNHKSISFFVQCLGSWDFELGIEVQSQSEVNDLMYELYGTFGDSITSISIFPVTRYLKVQNYPFSPQDTAVVSDVPGLMRSK